MISNKKNNKMFPAPVCLGDTPPPVGGWIAGVSGYSDCHGMATAPHRSPRQVRYPIPLG